MSQVRSQVRRRARGDRGTWAVFALALAVYLAAAYLAADRWQLATPEAMRRTVDAWLILAGQVHRLTALGAALPVGPTLAQLPLELLPAVRERHLGGGLVSAVAGALTVAVLDRALGGAGLGRRWRYPALALFALSPLVLLYAALPTAALPLTLLVAFSAHLLLWWGRTGNLQPLIALGFAAGAAILTSPDAVLYALALLGVVWWLARVSGQELAEPARRQPGRVRGLLLAYALPVLAILGIWLWLTALVLNDASLPAGAVWLRPSQDGATVTAGLLDGLLRRGPDVAAAPVATGPLLAAYALGLAPAFAAGLLFLVWDALRRRRADSAALALLGAFFPALAAAEALLLGPAPTLELVGRFLPVAPLALIFAGHLLARAAAEAAAAPGGEPQLVELAAVPSGPPLASGSPLREEALAPRRGAPSAPAEPGARASGEPGTGSRLPALRRGVWLGLAASALAGGATLAALAATPGWDGPTLGPRGLAAPRDRWPAERAVAAYLRAGLADGRALVDDAEGYRVIYLTGRPELVLTLADWRVQSSLRAGRPLGAAGGRDFAYLLLRTPRPGEPPGALSRELVSLVGSGAADEAAVVQSWPAAGWRLVALSPNGSKP